MGKTLANNQAKSNNAHQLRRFGFSLLVSVIVAFILAWIYGFDPIAMFANLFKGAFVGKLNFGTTLEKFTTILLLATAFNICIKVGFFNLGLEGSMYLGALAYAVVGYQFPNLPGYLYVPLCVLAAMFFGAIWGFLPAFLKTKWKVNEVCVTLLLNYVVTLFTTYAVYYIWAAKTSVPQTPELCDQVEFLRILAPSRAHIGLFISIAVYSVAFYFVYRTRIGYQQWTVGQNEHFAEYIGINTRKTVVLTVMLSGALAGLAGGMEIAGLYGRFVDEFGAGATFNGLLASRLVSNAMPLIPASAFVLAALQAGAYGVERACGIPRNFIDCFTTIIIMLITMEGFYDTVVGGCGKLIRRMTRKDKKTEKEVRAS